MSEGRGPDNELWSMLRCCRLTREVICAGKELVNSLYPRDRYCILVHEDEDEDEDSPCSRGPMRLLLNTSSRVREDRLYILDGKVPVS